MSQSEQSVASASTAYVSDGVHLRPGEAAARLDRLPLSGLHWRLSFITQACWGFLIALDGPAARLYPTVWQPQHLITPIEFTILYAAQVGIGLLVGEYVVGFLSDRFGRKRMLAISLAIAGFFFAFLSISQDFWWQLGFSFVASIGIGGMLAINVVYMQEIAPPQIRARVSQGAQSIAVLLSGAIAGAVGAALVPAHYQLWILILAAAVIFINLPLVIWGLPESPRWLEGKGMEDKAIRSLEKIERTVSKNGRIELPPADIGNTIVGVTEKVPLREVLTGTYLARTIIIAACWMLFYAGSVYGFGEYLGVFLIDKGYTAAQLFLVTGVGAGIAAFATMWIFSWIGERIERKTAILVGAILFSIGLLAAAFASNFWVIAFAAMVAASGEDVILMNFYIYTANAYPTRLRSVGTGWTDGLGHTGSIWGPFVATALYGIANSSGWGWVLWCVIPGALLPGLVIAITGQRQAKTSLEQLTS